MTSEQLRVVLAKAAEDTAAYRALTDRHTHTGQVFDPNQPLPTMPNHRTTREWEPTDKDTK